MKSFIHLATLVGLICAQPGGHAATFSADWKYFQTMQVESTGFVKISVPVETLDAARLRLEDVRLFDADGREVPFRIERFEAQPLLVTAKNFQVRIESNHTVAAFETGLSGPLRSIILETPATGFIKAATVEGAAEGQDWKLLGRGLSLFRQSDGASLLELPVPPGAWARMRVSLDDQRSGPIPLTGARVVAGASEPAPTEALAVKITEREELPGRTRLVLQAAGAHARLDGLHVDAHDLLFSRTVTLAFRELQAGEIQERVLAHGMIFRVAVAGQQPVAHLTFASGVELPSRELVLNLENGDSPPLNIAAVRAIRRPVYLAWQAAQPGDYHLLSGNSRCSAPRYDLAAFPAKLAATPVTPHRWSALTANPDYRTAEVLAEYRETGTPIDLSKWRFRKRILLADAGVHQIELDLETLARAAAGLGDLRVVKEGRQLPYLLDRTTLTRSFTPFTERADDPKRPSVSLWRLKLPYASSPATQLTCETDAPFFQRSVRLIERVADARGERYPVALGSANWTKTPGQKAEKLGISFAAPTTDTLVLEVENGDNPPIALKNFQCAYTTARVIIKTTGGANTFLYYGHPGVGAPRYDLDLAARQLLDADTIKSGLSPAEALHPAAWQTGEGNDGPKWFFWVVLALVVIGLLLILARLLPKGSA